MYPEHGHRVMVAPTVIGARTEESTEAGAEPRDANLRTYEDLLLGFKELERTFIRPTLLGNEPCIGARPVYRCIPTSRSNDAAVK